MVHIKRQLRNSYMKITIKLNEKTIVETVE